MVRTKFYLMLVLVFANFTAGAQTENDYIEYLDSLERPTTQANSDFYRVFKDFYSNTSNCTVNDFYKSGARRMTGTYSDKHNRTKTGAFLYYYESGKLQSQVQYANGVPVGKCYFWYENGNKKSECEFLKVKYEQDPVLAVHQYWSRIGIHRVVNGKGHFTDEDATSFSEGELKNGVKQGEWWGTDYKDNFTFVENYRKGKLVTGVSTDSLRQKHLYFGLYMAARPKKGYDDFDQYFKLAVEKHPELKEYAKDTIDITFTIQSNGKIAGVKTPGEENPKIGEILQEIFDQYGAWLPAQSRGINTDTFVSLPIAIR